MLGNFRQGIVEKSRRLEPPFRPEILAPRARKPILPGSAGILAPAIRLILLNKISLYVVSSMPRAGNSVAMLSF